MKTSTYYINLIQNRGNTLYNLGAFLRQDNGDGFAKVAKLFKGNHLIKELMQKKYFPEQICEKNPYYLELLPLEKLLLWNCHLINVYANEIIAFSEKKAVFEKMFLSSRYDEAYAVCEEVRQEYGCSMWLLDSYGLLNTFSDKKYGLKKDFEDGTLNYYSLLLLKNEKSERQTQYINRINHLLLKLGEPFRSYFKYKLFCETSCSGAEVDKRWKNILDVESSKSIIDIYLTTLDCLQYYVRYCPKNKLRIFDCCMELISHIDIPCCKILYAGFANEKIHYDVKIETSCYIDWMRNEEYDKILNAFVQEGLGDYNSFTTYRYVAIAALHCNSCLEISLETLSNKILSYTYNILGKNKIELVQESCESLRSMARYLRSFIIHKGICLFLNTELNVGTNYHIAQQVGTYSDEMLLCFELNNDALPLLPYRALYTSNNKEILMSLNLNEVREKIPFAALYYETATIKMRVSVLISDKKISDAIALFVNSYIKNPFLVYCIEISEIREYLHNKIKRESDISLEELCYIFIDGEYRGFRSSCFLNFLDGALLTEPLKILEDSKYDRECVCFFLSRICSAEMLISLYTLFDSTDEAENYRINICKLLSKDDNPYSREAKTEAEELTKNKALQQRLVNVDRSRVSIDTLKIQQDVFEDIENQIGICNALISKELSAQTQDSYLIINPKTDAYLSLYETYAKMFCFSQSGLDTSLSTRVRHGAFENQIFRIFTENHLIYNDGNNQLFQPLLEKGMMEGEAKTVLQTFHSDVQNKLQYFTQHTLKVFIDEPIEGAVFDYSVKNVGDEGLDIALWLESWSGTMSNATEAIKMLHKLLINKTNQYLETIRTRFLIELENDLIGILDDLSKKIYACTKNSSTRREVQRSINQCKMALQSEFKTVAGWFYLSEYEEWEDYSFSELLDICLEITKKLFVGFERVRINNAIDDHLIFGGKTFRCNTDMLSIMLNNAFLHSGFCETPEKLIITCALRSDEDGIFIEVENNLSNFVDIKQLAERIEQINDAYKNGIYRALNTRQEGGMGLYKIMLILCKTMNAKDAFCISLNDHKVKVGIKLPKELICYEKNTIS